MAICSICLLLLLAAMSFVHFSSPFDCDTLHFLPENILCSTYIRLTMPPLGSARMDLDSPIEHSSFCVLRRNFDITLAALVFFVPRIRCCICRHAKWQPTHIKFLQIVFAASSCSLLADVFASKRQRRCCHSGTTCICEN